MGGGCSRGIAVVDLNDCDREPIHIPGTIQPFGVLFALDEEMKVTQVSENVSDHLSLRVDEALGRPLSEIVDPAGAEEVRSVLREQRWHDANPLSIGARGKRFDGIVHHHEGAAILELEPNPETPEERSIHHPFRAALLRVQRASTLSELAAIITQEMRRTTGFERVMFYRFHEDGSGSVDAEARDAAHEPYLGLHYPASDIPAQARSAVSQELVASHLRRRPEASADRSGPATRHRSATRPQLLGASKRLAHSHRVHEEHGRSRVDEHLAHRAESAVGAHQLFEPHRSAARLAPDAIGMRVHGPPGVASDRRVRGPRAARVARVAPSDGGRVAPRDEGGHGQRARGPRRSAEGTDGPGRRRWGRRRGEWRARHVRRRSAGRRHPRDRALARREGRSQAVLFRFTRSPLSAGARGERRRKWSAHVRAARRSADVVPAGGHPDGELGRRSNQARRCGGRQAPAPAPLVRSVEGGGARPLPSVDAERSRGRRRVAAPRHGSGHRAASFQRAARRARAR